MSEATDADGEEAGGSPLDDEGHLEELYHDQGLTQSEIAEEYGVTASTVSHYMSKHGVGTRAHAVDDERLTDPGWLREQYIEEGRTMQDIAEDIGCSDGTVMRRVHEHVPEEELAERDGTRVGSGEGGGEAGEGGGDDE
jgi:transposase-like protein